MKKLFVFLPVLFLLLTNSVYAGTKVSAMPSASVVNAADTIPIVQSGVNKGAAASLLTNALSAADILTKIKTVDGTGSGLDADLLDGQHATAIAVPPGAIMAFGNLAGCPTGWLPANGAINLSRTTYAALYAVYATTYGTYDSSTFGVPDLRGEFIRGMDLGRGVDSGRALGSAQAQDIQSHAHSASSGLVHNTTPGGSFDIYSLNSSTGTTGNTGGTETRPRNVAFPYCIKY